MQRPFLRTNCRIICCSSAVQRRSLRCSGHRSELCESACGFSAPPCALYARAPRLRCRRDERSSRGENLFASWCTEGRRPPPPPPAPSARSGVPSACLLRSRAIDAAAVVHSSCISYRRPEHRLHSVSPRARRLSARRNPDDAAASADTESLTLARRSSPGPDLPLGRDCTLFEGQRR